MSSIIRFLKNPSLKKQGNDTLIESIKTLLSAYFFCISFTIISAFVIIIVEAILKYQFHISSPIDGYYQMIDKMNSRFGKYSLLIITIVAPILEETMFRLYLTLNKWHILISASILTYAFTGPILSTNSGISFPFRLMIVIIILILIILIAWINRRRIEDVRSKYYFLAFYFSALLFGMVHISNFSPLNERIFFIYPLLVLPQIGMGLSIGYVRVTLKNGFFWGILLHVFINTPAVLLYLIDGIRAGK